MKKRRRPSPPKTKAKRDARIVELVMGQGLTASAVARRFRITPTRVVQILRAAGW